MNTGVCSPLLRDSEVSGGEVDFVPPKDKTPASCLEGVLRAVRA